MLRAEGLGLQRAGRWDLRGVDLAVAPGEAWALAGPSGAGKSTLLDLLLGLEAPTEGTVHLEGDLWNPLPERRRRARRPRIQAVLQDARASLPPHRTGWELLRDPLEAHGLGAGNDRLLAMARRVALPEAALDLRPGDLSGGMAQRLCLGRALLLEPALLVLDEPFAGLDPILETTLRDLLAAERARGLSLLVATHDLRAVAGLCGGLLVLEAGRVAARGPLLDLVGPGGPPEARGPWEAAFRL